MLNIISLNSQIGFELFDQTHLIWLVIVSLGLVLGCAIYIKLDIKQKKKMEYILSYTLLLLEAIKLVVVNMEGKSLLYYMPIHSFLFHMVILLFPLMLVMSRRHKPSLNLILAPVSFLIVIVPIVYYFNRATGTNYMFLNWPIKGTPIMTLADWFGEPGYIFGMVIVLLLVWLLLYSKEIVTLVLRQK